jgi:hypothetical protein
MTVFCRSNDLIWGAYGANAVHMSILQEYVACGLARPVGHYWQVSNNYHVYESAIVPIAARMLQPTHWLDEFTDPYEVLKCKSIFHDTDLSILHKHLWSWSMNPTVRVYGQIPLITHLLVPMARVWEDCHRGNWTQAEHSCDEIQFPDWQRAARQYIYRRSAAARSRALAEGAE